MKTFMEILSFGCEGNTFRDIVNNLEDKQILESIEEYAQQFSNRLEKLVIPQNLHAMEKLIAKQALEIDSLKTKLENAEDKIKNVINIITCIGAPLNDNYHQYNKNQLKIFFEIHQILSE